MATTNTTSLSIAEMREFASFSPCEQRFIRRNLDIGLGRCDAFKLWARNASENVAIRRQYVAYQDLKSLRHSIPEADAGEAEPAGDFRRRHARVHLQQRDERERARRAHRTKCTVQ